MAVGRNDPCPSGSGKKHKNCCGASIAIAPVAPRHCGGCTPCCDGRVVGVIEGREMKPGSPFPEDFRPDRIGVMVIRMRWRGREAYVPGSAGRDPGERVTRGEALW